MYIHLEIKRCSSPLCPSLEKYQKCHRFSQCYILLYLYIKSNEPKREGMLFGILVWNNSHPNKAYILCNKISQYMIAFYVTELNCVCVLHTLSQPYLTQYDLKSMHLTCVFLWLYTNRTARGNQYSLIQCRKQE